MRNVKLCVKREYIFFEKCAPDLNERDTRAVRIGREGEEEDFSSMTVFFEAN